MNCFSFFVTSNSNRQATVGKRKREAWLSVCIFSCSCIVLIVCLATILPMTTTLKHKPSPDNDRTVKLAKPKETGQQNQKRVEITQRNPDRSCLFNHNRVENDETDIITLGCGGTIPLPRKDSSVLLDYKSQKYLSNDENCLWILDSSTTLEKRYHAKIQISMQCEGLEEGDDYIAVLDWNEWAFLTPFVLSHGRSYSESKTSDWHYLSFNSGNSSTLRTGFILRLTTLDILAVHPGINMAFTNATGSIVYGPNKSQDRIAIVINPPVKSFVVLLHYMESKRTIHGSCHDHESLHIFSVGRKGAHSKLPLTICGTKGYRLLAFDQPVLIGFLTSVATKGQGFKLSWKQT